MFDFEESLLVNRWVQGHEADDTLRQWFAAQGPEMQLRRLIQIGELCTQARFDGEDAFRAVADSGIKPTRNACSLLVRWPTQLGLRKLEKLRDRDAEDAWMLLLYTLRHADRRRRASEPEGPCQRHWWHRDLGDPSVIAELMRTRGL
jgi:hypothetical protein